MEKYQSEFVKTRIPHCFDGDFSFALHPSDEKIAEELKMFMKNREINSEEVIQFFSDYLLDDKKIVAERYPEEMKKIRDFFQK